VGAGVPVGLAVLGVFKGVQVFVFHFVFPPFLIREKGIKNTHPLNKDQGWDTKYSTVPPWLRQMPSLIGTVTGAPGVAFPRTQLRSGIVSGRVTDALHQNDILSENLSGTACLHHSFFIQKM